MSRPGRPVTLVDLLAVAALALGLAGACGAGTLSIATTPMAGRIGGQDWTLGTAESVAFLSKDDLFFIHGYAETFAPCTGAGDLIISNQLILNLPKTAGDYALSLDLSETFSVPSTNHSYIATQGRIIVDEVTATTVRGGGHFQFDGDNVVDGQFVAQICPP
jgi:hypothetical protein